MPEKIDALTEEQTMRVLADLIEAAGPGGIEKDDLYSQYGTVYDEIANLRAGVAILHEFDRGRLKVAVNRDGEVVYRVTEPRMVRRVPERRS